MPCWLAIPRLSFSIRLFTGGLLSSPRTPQPSISCGLWMALASRCNRSLRASASARSGAGNREAGYKCGPVERTFKPPRPIWLQGFDPPAEGGGMFQRRNGPQFRGLPTISREREGDARVDPARQRSRSQHCLATFVAAEMADICAVGSIAGGAQYFSRSRNAAAVTKLSYGSALC